MIIRDLWSWSDLENPESWEAGRARNSRKNAQGFCAKCIDVCLTCWMELRHDTINHVRTSKMLV